MLNTSIHPENNSKTSFESTYLAAPSASTGLESSSALSQGLTKMNQGASRSLLKQNAFKISRVENERPWSRKFSASTSEFSCESDHSLEHKLSNLRHYQFSRVNNKFNSTKTEPFFSGDSQIEKKQPLPCLTVKMNPARFSRYQKGSEGLEPELNRTLDQNLTSIDHEAHSLEFFAEGKEDSSKETSFQLEQKNPNNKIKTKEEHESLVESFSSGSQSSCSVQSLDYCQPRPTRAPIDQNSLQKRSQRLIRNIHLEEPRVRRSSEKIERTWKESDLSEPVPNENRFSSFQRTIQQIKRQLTTESLRAAGLKNMEDSLSPENLEHLLSSKIINKIGEVLHYAESYQLEEITIKTIKKVVLEDKNEPSFGEFCELRTIELEIEYIIKKAYERERKEKC